MSGLQFAYGFDKIVVHAKHLIDVGDKIEFTCKSSDWSNIVPTAFDASVPAWKLSMDVLSPGLVDCTKTVTSPGGIVGLIVAIVQGCILCLLGPAIMMYGPSVPRFTSLIKAVVVSSYILLINSIVTVSEFTAFMVFEKTVTLVISTLTVTYTSLNNPGAKAKAAGFALGTLIGTPLVAFISEQLYKLDAIGCTGVGEKREWFPNGEPTGSIAVARLNHSFSPNLPAPQLARLVPPKVCVGGPARAHKPMSQSRS